MSRKSQANANNPTFQRQLELPAIMRDMGIIQKMVGLLIYNSLRYPTDFVYRKPFRSQHFSIIIVLKGSVEVKVNLFSYSLQERDVIIIPPSAIREITWEQSEVHFISCLFTQEFLQEAGIKGRYFSIAHFLDVGLSAANKLELADYGFILRMIELQQDILQAESFRQEDEEVIRSLFKAMLLKLKPYYTEYEADRNLSGTLIYKFVALLSANYLQHREVAFYSEKLNLNEKYLTQLLKKKTGKTAREFITDLVILEAKVLLANQSLSVKEIANQLNFENQFHFSRFFKQYGGVSPTEYRTENPG